MTTTRTAVLDDTRLYWRGDNGDVAWHSSLGPINAERLCELGLRFNLHCIWVLPGSHISQQANKQLGSIDDYTGEYDVRLKYRDGTRIPVFGTVNRLRGTWDEKRFINFGFPEHDPRWMTDGETWALADIEKPIELLDVIVSTEAALTPRRIVRGETEKRHFHMAYSPGWSGLDLIKSVNKLYAHIAWTREADLSALPPCSEPGGFKWKRKGPLTAEEQGKKYIHFYDRNSQFPAAATGAECGEGTPEYKDRDFVWLAWDNQYPGVWHITVERPDYLLTSFTEEHHELLFSLFDEGTYWAYTDTVKALKKLGYDVTFHEAWVWPVHHRTLQDWAKHMWEARRELREKYGKGSPQEHLAKMITNQGLQWLNLTKRRIENRTNEPWQREDWLNMVHSLARYRMVLKIVELAEQGYYPVMIVADNLAYVSDELNPETAIPGLMRRKDELGGFKHDGTYLLEQVLPLLENGMGADEIRTHVKLMAKAGFTIENINTSVGDKDIDAWLERQGE